jgi:hypothetical protein
VPALAINLALAALASVLLRAMGRASGGDATSPDDYLMERI